MRLLPLLCLALLLAAPAPAAAEQFGSFDLTLQNDSQATVSYRVNRGEPVELAPGKSGSWARGFDLDQLAASPTYVFQMSLRPSGGGPSCAARVVVEVSAWGDDYLFSCAPRREVLGPCLITCDYDNVGPNSSARVVYRPKP